MTTQAATETITISQLRPGDIYEAAPDTRAEVTERWVGVGFVQLELRWLDDHTTSVVTYERNESKTTNVRVYN